MKIIAHRANIDGSLEERENSIEQINLCIDTGYDVEIDVRVIDNELFLGHDFPKLKISEDFLLQIKDKSWIHCKNLEAITYFYNKNDNFNYFWHQEDDYTLTSKGYIWAYPGKPLSIGCISVMPDLDYKKEDFKNLHKFKIFGVCTDFPNLFS